MAVVTVGLIGCGAMGRQLARTLQKRYPRRARLIGVYDADLSKAREMATRLNPSVPVLPLQALVSRSQLLIEAASPKAVAQLLPKALAKRRPVLVMSAGGLLSQISLLKKFRIRGVPLYVPSGALVGLDGIKAAAVGRLSSVTLTTRKPPRSFAGAAGALRKRIRLDRIRQPTVLYEGNAAAAVRLFPQNINVAATLALAGIGPARTRVRIIADPAVRANVHEVEAAGSFGTMFLRTENRPSSINPKTSQLAIQSAVAALDRILDSFQVGT